MESILINYRLIRRCQEAGIESRTAALYKERSVFTLKEFWGVPIPSLKLNDLAITSDWSLTCGPCQVHPRVHAFNNLAVNLVETETIDLSPPPSPLKTQVLLKTCEPNQERVSTTTILLSYLMNSEFNRVLRKHNEFYLRIFNFKPNLSGCNKSFLYLTQISNVLL